MIDALNVMSVYDALKSKTGLDIRVSTMGVNISDSLHGSIKGYYGFYNTGAVRVDVNSEGDVVQICVWRKPGDLNRPDSKVDTSEADALSFISTVSDLMSGQMLESSFLESEDRLLFTEGAKDDVADFLSENPEALESKISHAYLQYDAWARENGRKQMSSVYFSNNLRALKASMDPITSSRGPRGVLSGSEDPERTLVEPTEEDIFVNDIMNNEIYYKAAMYENVLRRMSKDDPGIVSLFVYGGPGLGKTFTCKKILKEEGAWETKVTYKSGSIAGFTGLLQLLWDNRKGKIIVLDDNDSLLVGNIAAANILKAALNTDPEDRIISYTRFRRQ